MNHRERKPYPGADALKTDKEQGLSNVKIAHKYGVSSQTIHRWMVKAGIEQELPSDEPDEQRFAKMVKAQDEPVVVEGELLMPVADAQNAPLAVKSESQPPLPPQDQATQDTEPETAFEQCSQSQKKALMILTDQPNITGKDLAALTGVSEQSIITWKQSPLFQQALKELLVPAFKTEALLMVVSDLKRVIQSQKARPEDRKLLAEISGLINGESTVVNVGIAMDDYLGRRFR